MSEPNPATPTIASPDIASSAIECICKMICGCLMPFFLSAADGDHETACAAILKLMDAYKATTTTELDLVGRIVGFSIVALDNLRLSMAPDVSHSMVLRYRTNAVALSRASEQASQILRELQDNQEPTRKIPRPAVAAAPASDQRHPAPQKPEAARTGPAPTNVAANVSRGSASPASDIVTMEREARVMLAAFSKQGAGGGSTIQMIPDPAAMIGPAVRSAFNAVRRPSQT